MIVNYKLGLFPPTVVISNGLCGVATQPLKCLIHLNSVRSFRDLREKNIKEGSFNKQTRSEIVFLRSFFYLVIADLGETHTGEKKLLATMERVSSFCSCPLVSFVPFAQHLEKYVQRCRSFTFFGNVGGRQSPGRSWS